MRAIRNSYKDCARPADKDEKSGPVNRDHILLRIDPRRHKILADSQAEESDVSMSFEELESFGDKDSLREMFHGINNYNQMLKERITFINPYLTDVIPFTRENLYLICAYSGNGKSSCAANVSYPLWQQQKKSLVISNEESEQDILFRIACLELGYNFNAYKKGRMPIAQQREVAKLFPFIAKYVKVVDVNAKNGITTKAEGIMNILEKVQDKDYSCVMIDYYQLITKSIKSPNASTYEVLNNLRMWFGRYIKRSNIPIVIFAQLHSLGKRNNKDLDSRIKDSPTIYEAATVVIEMIPNFENLTTEFLVHKDRFGCAGQKITCGFDRGRFIELTDKHFKQVQDDKVDELIQQLGVSKPQDESEK